MRFEEFLDILRDYTQYVWKINWNDLTQQGKLKIINGRLDNVEKWNRALVVQIAKYVNGYLDTDDEIKDFKRFCDFCIKGFVNF